MNHNVLEFYKHRNLANCSSQASLSSHQMSLLCDHRRHLQDKLQAQLTAEFQRKLSEGNNEVCITLCILKYIYLYTFKIQIMRHYFFQAPKRNVTSLLKVKLVGLANADIDTRTSKCY